jgi:hypothetical protein
MLRDTTPNSPNPPAACHAHWLKEFHMEHLAWVHRWINLFLAPYLLRPVSHTIF